MSSKPQQPPIPERFRVAKPTLLFDRFMNYFITLGGIGIIVAVSLIFVFILIQIFPLFRGATVEPEASQSIPAGDFVAMGSDEWSELPFFVTPAGSVYLLDRVEPESETNRGWYALGRELPEDSEVTSISLKQKTNEIAIGLADGRFTVKRVDYEATFPGAAGRVVTAEVNVLPLLTLSEAGHPLVEVAYGDSGTAKLAAAIVESPQGRQLQAVTLAQRRSLFGAGEISVDRSYDLTPLLEGVPVALLVPWEGNSVIARLEDGRVQYLFLESGGFVSRQIFRPFEGYNVEDLARMDFILGDVSIVFSNGEGAMSVWSLYHDGQTNNRIFGKSKSFEPFGNIPDYFSLSARNKAFLVGHGNQATLRYMTTESTRWESKDLPFTAQLGVIAPRYNRMLFLDTESNLHVMSLDDPHPQAGWKTYFSKIRYEGQDEASFTWQSTGGRDDFESKLSMVPLIIGTFKGTIYAMLFAVPIALLAALYTSQFLDPKIKNYIKPTMEIMASLPSVVLGFLAALWLAPIVSNAVPSVILSLVGVTLGTIGFGYGWTKLPNWIRLRVRPGWEFLLVLPVASLCAWIGWQLGPVSERLFFTVTDPNTGLTIPSFRMWYPEAFGLGFEQRNAFVVGFVMGFAVIPIIFTITEDSLSNVPDAFRSGSLALGASRWQTAVRVVVPTASAGIFSGLMIGLGRAVGETMIVVMATGNVATTELNPFTGMRTLSANIAVELPEAPYLGTLYRSLFLGAMILFMLTFIVNTGAEVLRQKLRERYRAVE